MPYCPNCGEEVDEGVEFCSNCGASIEGESSRPKGGKTSLDMEENLEGALCYALTWVTGIIFLVLEKDNKFVRFHAMQSIVTFLPLTIIGWLLNMVATPYYGWGWGFSPFWIISWLIWLIVLGLWLLLMYKAYQGEKFKLPVVGDIAENQV